MTKKEKLPKRTSIGGQAVMEGVMMRGKSSMATAVRDADGIIRIESKRLTPPEKQNKFLKLPIIRGCVNFVSSMIGGTKTLMRSAEVYGESEPSKFEKWLSKTFKIDLMSVIIFVSMLLGVGLAIGLFILAPIGLRRLIEIIVGKDFAFSIVAKNFIEGGFKILIFIMYIALVSLLKDIKRTFMYHGAEHKTISCYEKGLPLTAENAKKCTRVHNRCGTTFMVFVIVISILVFAIVEAIFGYYGVSIEKIWRVLLKLALLPLVAGLSYELLKGLAKTDCWVFYPLKAPGLLLQRLTTKEPTVDMLEVAIAAFNKVLEMDADATIKEQQFVTPKKASVITAAVAKTLFDNGVTEKAEAEWIVSIKAGIKRDEVYSSLILSARVIDEINKVVEMRITGRPLWYVLGDTEFYGYKIKVDERVLIPRPETEELVENALKLVKTGGKVLDMCTGSGAIAIAIKRQREDLEVTASDISSEALELAKENAQLNNAEINFISSDMFSEITGEYDLIITNPPYIKSGDIAELAREVKSYEPILALDGGEDGLKCYRSISENFTERLAENGVLLMECGINESEEIKEIFSKYKVTIIKDLEQVERIIKVELYV